MAEEIQGYRFVVGLDGSRMTRSLKEIRQEARYLKTAMRDNFAQIRSGEGIMSAYANKVTDAKNAIQAQKDVISKVRQAQSDLDQSTEKGRRTWVKYESEIQRARRNISSIESQQRKATVSAKAYESGVVQLGEKNRSASRLIEASSKELSAQGRTMEAQKVKLRGLISVYKGLGDQIKRESELQKTIKQQFGSSSREYQAQAERIANLKVKYAETGREIKTLNKSVGGMNTPMAKFHDTTSKIIHSGAVQKLGQAIRYAGAGATVAGAAMLSGARKASTLQQAYKETYNLIVQGGEKAKDATRGVTEMQRQGQQMSVQYGVSQKRIADGYGDLVRRGYTSKQALGAMRTELQASIASGDKFEDVVKVSSQTLESFGMRADSTAKMTANTKKAVNELAYAADATSAGFSDMGVGMSYVGATAHASHIPLHEAAAALGELSNRGLEADKAGTGLRQVINSLTSQVGKIGSKGSVFDKLGIKKQEIVDSTGKLRSLSTVMGVIWKHTKNMSATQRNTQRNNIFKSLFGTTGMQAGIILAQTNKQLGDMSEKVKKAGDSGTYVQRIADKNSKTAQMSIRRFKQAANALEMEIAAQLLPSLTRVTTRMVKTFNDKDFQAGVKTAARDVGHFASGVEHVGEVIIKHRQGIISFGKVLADIFIANKVVSYARKLRTLWTVFQSGKPFVSAEKVEVNELTNSYKNLATAKEKAAKADSGSSVSVPTSGKGETVEAPTGIKGKVTGVVSSFGKVAGAAAAVDVTTSLIGALSSNSAKTRYRAGGKTVGTTVGGGIGAALGSIVPGIGTMAGAGLGASIGDYIGGSKFTTSLFEKAHKSLKGKSVSIPVKAKLTGFQKDTRAINGKTKKDMSILVKMGLDSKSTKKTQKEASKAVKSINKSIDSYYKTKEKNAKKDLDLLVKNGQMTKKQEQASLKRLQQNDKKEAESRKKSYKSIQTALKNHNKALEKIENTHYKSQSSKNKALEKENKRFYASYAKTVFKANKNINADVKRGANQQLAIRKKLQRQKGKLNISDLKATRSTADKEYKAATSSARKTRDQVVKAAKDKYQKTISAANHQYKDTKTISHKQYKAIVANAKKQRDDVTDAADKQYSSSVKSAREQHQGVKREIDAQRRAATYSANKQSSDVVGAAETQANSSMEAHKRQATGVGSIFNSILSFFNGIATALGFKGAGGSHKITPSYTRVSGLPTHAKGGSIAQSGMALVGEAGPEARYQPYGDRIDFVGLNGPEIVPVKSGDQILNARDTKRLVAGEYKGTLPGYALGNVDLAGFVKNIENKGKKFLKGVKEKTLKTISKIGDPLKKVEDIGRKAFDIDSVPHVGTLPRSIDKAMVKRYEHGFAKVIGKLIDKVKNKLQDIAGAKNPGGAGVQRWRPYIKKAAKEMHVNLTSAGMSAILKRIAQESNGNPTIQNNWDSNAKAGHPSIGLLQYIQPTLDGYAVKGHKNIRNGYDQLLALFNDKTWLSDISAPGGWGPSGGRRYANGGLITRHQIAEVGEGNLPEMIIPLDVSKKSRTYQQLGQVVAMLAKRDGTSFSDSGTNTEQLQQGLENLTNITSQLLSVVNKIAKSPVPAVVSGNDVYNVVHQKQKRKQLLDNYLS